MLQKLLELLGIVHENERDNFHPTTETLEEKSNRLLQPISFLPKILICHNCHDVDRKTEMAEALHRGQFVIVDLHNTDHATGQSILDFLCGVAYAMRGTVVRISPGVFLASPQRGWIESLEDSGQIKRDSPKEDEEA